MLCLPMLYLSLSQWSTISSLPSSTSSSLIRPTTNQQQSIASKDPPYPQTNRHFLPWNRSPSSDHRFDTNHPHPTPTTQKQRPICHGSHQAHGHRFLNLNPPYPQTSSSSEQRSSSFLRPPICKLRN